MIGHPVHHEAALILEGLGGDASNFAARQLTSRIASEADLVLTMTRPHRDAVLELAPRLLRRTFTLTEAARLVSECNATTIGDLSGFRAQLAASEAPDILDPIGQDSGHGAGPPSWSDPFTWAFPLGLRRGRGGDAQ